MSVGIANPQGGFLVDDTDHGHHGQQVSQEKTLEDPTAFGAFGLRGWWLAVDLLQYPRNESG